MNAHATVIFPQFPSPLPNVKAAFKIGSNGRSSNCFGLPVSVDDATVIQELDSDLTLCPSVRQHPYGKNVCYRLRRRCDRSSRWHSTQGRRSSHNPTRTIGNTRAVRAGRHQQATFAACVGFRRDQAGETKEVGGRHRAGRGHHPKDVRGQEDGVVCGYRHYNEQGLNGWTNDHTSSKQTARDKGHSIHLPLHIGSTHLSYFTTTHHDRATTTVSYRHITTIFFKTGKRYSQPTPATVQ
jgi:hypothetical protein